MKNFYLTAIIYCLVFPAVHAQTIGTFTSVAGGGQTQSLVLPPTHTFQRIIKSGDALTAGGTLGSSLDFTGYVPKAGSSRSGYLSISSESTPAAVAIMDVTFNVSTSTWSRSNSGNVPFPTAAFGTVPVTRFCSGTVTPNGTIMVSEENVGQGDTNTDGYNDDGWIIEIDPVTKTVLESDATHTGVDKLWAIGRQSRENVLILPDNKTLYTGADNGTANSFVYKFVATTAGDFSSGLLYVLVTTGSFGTGSWKLIPNTTKAERNGTIASSTAAPAAYSFNGVEDMEVGPDGKVYFTAKGPGRIYRFKDDGATVSGLEIFVANTNYDLDPGPGVVNELWDIGNDNLAFDGEGNLWVLQDGARNHIWVVGPTHTAATPAVRLFGKTPAGSEPTGITFTPDYKYMFISLQHPTVSNSASQVDAAGVSVVFNTHTTLVISRIENLGPLSTLPVRFTYMNAKAINNTDVEINWTAEDITNHAFFVVERSADGLNFEEIYRNTEVMVNGAKHSFSHMDLQKTNASILYYRIKQCNADGSCTYSKIQQVKLINKEQLKLFPTPASTKVNLSYASANAGSINIHIIDAGGSILINETKKVLTGENSFSLNIQKLQPGTYTVVIYDGNERFNEKLVKL
jgi:uncharacterized protein